MATPVTYNTKLDPNTSYTFDLTITDNDEVPMDISSWTFQFIMTNSSGSAVWTINNGDFSRPSTGQITFTKTVSQVQALSNGLYTISLLVTKSGATNDEYMTGTFQK